MKNAEEPTALIETLMKPLGFSVLDCLISRHRGAVHVHVVLHRDGGVNLEDLTKVQKLLRPRLEMLFDRKELVVEVASPGVGRTFKNVREYRVFIGRRVRLLVEKEWLSGVLAGFDGRLVSLKTDFGPRDIPIEAIRRGRLAEERGV